MLEHLNHPFLCNLRYSFQDIEYLYDDHNCSWQIMAVNADDERTGTSW